ARILFIEPFPKGCLRIANASSYQGLEEAGTAGAQRPCPKPAKRRRMRLNQHIGNLPSFALRFSHYASPSEFQLHYHRRAGQSQGGDTMLYNALSDFEIKTQQRHDLIGRVAHSAARTMIKKLILPLHDAVVQKIVHGAELLLPLSHDLPRYVGQYPYYDTVL